MRERFFCRVLGRYKNSMQLGLFDICVHDMLATSCDHGNKMACLLSGHLWFWHSLPNSSNRKDLRCPLMPHMITSDNGGGNSYFRKCAALTRVQGKKSPVCFSPFHLTVKRRQPRSFVAPVSFASPPVDPANKTHSPLCVLTVCFTF